MIDGPEVIIVNPEVILQEPGAQRSATFGEILDKAGAAFWEAAERREPIGSIVFASMVRRGLTDVPQTWTLGTQAPSPLDRHPDLLVAELRIASERACRALGTLVGPATEASKHEEPLLDKTALTWKAMQCGFRLFPSIASQVLCKLGRRGDTSGGFLVMMTGKSPRSMWMSSSMKLKSCRSPGV